MNFMLIALLRCRNILIHLLIKSLCCPVHRFIWLDYNSILVSTLLIKEVLDREHSFSSGVCIVSLMADFPLFLQMLSAHFNNNIELLFVN